MKEFEFDDIEISDDVEEQPTEKVENLKEDPLYQKFSFDIDSARFLNALSSSSLIPNANM